MIFLSDSRKFSDIALSLPACSETGRPDKHPTDRLNRPDKSRQIAHYTTDRLEFVMFFYANVFLKVFFPLGINGPILLHDKLQ